MREVGGSASAWGPPTHSRMSSRFVGTTPVAFVLRLTPRSICCRYLFFVLYLLPALVRLLLCTRALELGRRVTGSNSRHPCHVCPRLQVVGGRRHARFTTTTASRRPCAWGFHVMVHACMWPAAVLLFPNCLLLDTGAPGAQRDGAPLSCPKAVPCMLDGLYMQPVCHLYGMPSRFCCYVHLIVCLLTLVELARTTEHPYQRLCPMSHRV